MHHAHGRAGQAGAGGEGATCNQEGVAGLGVHSKLGHGLSCVHLILRATLLQHLRQALYNSRAGRALPASDDLNFSNMSRYVVVYLGFSCTSIRLFRQTFLWHDHFGTVPAVDDHLSVAAVVDAQHSIKRLLPQVICIAVGIGLVQMCAIEICLDLKNTHEKRLSMQLHMKGFLLALNKEQFIFSFSESLLVVIYTACFTHLSSVPSPWPNQNGP